MLRLGFLDGEQLRRMAEHALDSGGDGTPEDDG
jgi:hypothetical protein